MRNSKIRGNIIMLFTLLYIVYLSVVTYLLNSQGLFISLVDVSITNIGRRLIGDCASIIFLSILIFIAICNNMQIQTGLTWGSSRGLVIFLAAAYFCLFFAVGDYSVKGIYVFLFYLIPVAFLEEFLFRGYLFSALEIKYDFWIAAIISGIFWGISHVTVRAVVYKYSFEGCIMACWNELGGGIVMGILFIFLFRKSKSIFIPTLIHAILDYLAMLPQK